jgi:hypothetical protein
MSIKRYKPNRRVAGTQTSRECRATLRRRPSGAADRRIAAGDGLAGTFFDGDEDIHGEQEGKTHSIPMQSGIQGKRIEKGVNITTRQGILSGPQTILPGGAK